MPKKSSTLPSKKKTPEVVPFEPGYLDELVDLLRDRIPRHLNYGTEVFHLAFQEPQVGPSRSINFTVGKQMYVVTIQKATNVRP